MSAKGICTKTLLIEEFGNGSPESFTSLVQTHSRRIYEMSFKMLRNHADAEDNLQNVLYKVFRSLDQFEGRSRFSTWIISITVNEALMRIRSRRREVLNLDSPNPENAGSMAVEIHDTEPNPERRYIAKELVAKAFAGVPAPARELFIRNQGEGWSHRELACELGTSVSAIKSRIFSVRTRMQKKLRAISWAERTKYARQAGSAARYQANSINQEILSRMLAPGGSKPAGLRRSEHQAAAC